MQQVETRAVWRAVLILSLVSIGRWAYAVGGAAPAGEGPSVLPALVEESRAGAMEAERRSLPLAEGERLDPNRASEVELDRLPGVGPAIARAIVQARDDGVSFRRPEDMLEVRGIGVATLERLRPLLDLRDAPPGLAPTLGSPGGRSPDAAGEPPVDINRADIETLQTLPGIGPALAARIIEARRQGSFASLEELVRVRGVGPATVERLRAHASAGRAR